MHAFTALVIIICIQLKSFIWPIFMGISYLFVVATFATATKIMNGDQICLRSLQCGKWELQAKRDTLIWSFQMIEAHNQMVLWNSFWINQTLCNIFTFQSKVTRKLAQKLVVKQPMKLVPQRHSHWIQAIQACACTLKWNQVQKASLNWQNVAVRSHIFKWFSSKFQTFPLKI